jgi:carbon-monoxide dehydrogenase medium subunit
VAVEAALLGRELTADTVAAAATAAGDSAGALDDGFASSRYRAHLATVVTRRAVTRAVRAAEVATGALVSRQLVRRHQ